MKSENNFILNLDELLKTFFNKKELSAILKNRKNGILKNNSEQDSNTDESFRTQADLLITYAQNNLSADKFLQFLQSLGQLSIISGQFVSARDLYYKIISICGDDENYKHISASSYVSLAEIYSRQAEWNSCKKHIKRAEILFEELNDKKGAAKCENLLGTIEGDCGNISKAKKHFEKSLAYLEDNPDDSFKGMIEINLGIISNIRGEFDEAITYYKRALVNFQNNKDVKRVAEIKHNIGMTYLKKNEYQKAINQFDQSISASLKINYLQSLTISYLSKADACCRLNDLEMAGAFAAKALEIAYRTNDRLSIADIYKIKGVIQKNLKNYTAAENYLLTSLRMNSDLGNIMNEAESAYELGLLYNEIENEKERNNQLNRALNYYKSINAAQDVENIRGMLPS